MGVFNKKVKEISIEFCTQLANEKKDLMLVLEDKLNILSYRENLNLDEVVRKNEIQAQLNAFYEEAVRGAQIRARIDQIEKGETNKKLYTA